MEAHGVGIWTGAPNFSLILCKSKVAIETSEGFKLSNLPGSLLLVLLLHPGFYSGAVGLGNSRYWGNMVGVKGQNPWSLVRG